MSEDVRRLILRAFQMARSSTTKEATWRRMRSPVLKNRLLILTDRSFDEKALGFANFHAFVLAQSDLLQLDKSTVPPTVELVAEPEVAGLLPPTAEPITPTPADGRVPKIRGDLWDAVMDFSSGATYVWDPRTMKVCRGGESIPGGLVMPTVTPDEFASWRQGFAQSLNLVGDDAEKVKRWAEASLPTLALPPRLRGQWNGELKRRAGERLRHWFDQQHLQIPDDWQVSASSGRMQAVGGAGAPGEALRELVLDFVRSMTVAELEELRLPPAALLRGRRTSR
jgi:hypothetical protein